MCLYWHWFLFRCHRHHHDSPCRRAWADRLAEDPDDLDGWLRLGNAYRVLGEMDKAREAFLSAEKLASNLASDDPRRVAIRDVLSEYSD